MMVVDFLEHHGIKGQKWGVRRDNYSRKRSTRELRKMSPDEIQAYVKRQKLERQYRDLIKEERKQRIEPGKEYVEGILKKIGKNVWQNLSDQKVFEKTGSVFTRGKWVSSNGRDDDD